MGMERVTVEQNGERITLEVPEGTSDADIQSFLGGGESQVSTPKPAAAAFQTAAPLATASQLNFGSNVPGPGAMGPVAPSNNMFKPTGFNPQILKDVAAPVSQLGQDVLGGYAAKPYKAVADAVLMHGGIPPVFGGIETLKKLPETYQSVKDVLGKSFSEVSKAASGSELATDLVSGGPKPSTIDPYLAMKREAPEIAKQLGDAYAKAGNNGVRNFLNGPGAQAAMSNPKFAALAEQYLGMVPSYLKQAGNAVAPVLRGAGRVLGPVGMGMNIYDAAKTARETQLGERLAQGQGGMAQQNFRQMNPGYGAPPSPEQAQNVLQSGSQRDIQAFGGQDRLNMLIREAAAKKALAGSAFNLGQ